jgi:hypothetical protein
MGDEASPTGISVVTTAPRSFRAAYHFFPNFIGQTIYAFVISAPPCDSTCANGIADLTALFHLWG